MANNPYINWPERAEHIIWSIENDLQQLANMPIDALEKSGAELALGEMILRANAIIDTLHIKQENKQAALSNLINQTERILQ